MSDETSEHGERAASSEDPSSVRGRCRSRDRRRAALILAALVALFLGTPIAHVRDAYFSPADLSQDFSLTRDSPRDHSTNPLASDVAVEMHPWLMFNRDELHSGRMPLWNPYNGGGVPHLASYQTAVLSPFSWPFYVLGFRAALLVAAFLKLWCLAFFAYLFLAEIELAFSAAVLGATVFAFAGQNVLLLQFPHPASVVALPAGLYFAEKISRRLERTADLTSMIPRPLAFTDVRDLAGLALSFAAGLLGGNPEPLFFSVALVALYAVARCIGIARARAFSRPALAHVVRLALQLAGAGLLAFGLAAVQWLPFFEYLANSRVVEERSGGGAALHLSTWPLLFFPNLLGNPSTGYVLSGALPPPDFESANVVYVGSVALLLALSSVFLARQKRCAWFFALCAGLWYLCAHDIAGFGRMFASIPLFSMAPVSRSQVIWCFSIAACAALALDGLVATERTRNRARLVAMLGGGAVLAVLFLWGAKALADETAASLRDPATAAPIYELGGRHVMRISASFALGWAAICALCTPVSKTMRGVIGALIVAIAFAQTGGLFRDYNPVCADRFFYPRTPAIATLQATVGTGRLATLGFDAIPPSLNLPFGLRTLANYDAMWVRDYDDLYRAEFGETNNWRPMLSATEPALQMFGVDWVLCKGSPSKIYTPFAEAPYERGARLPLEEILPGADLVQDFVAPRDELQEIEITLYTFRRANDCRLEIALEDPVAQRVLAQRSIDCHAIKTGVRGIRVETLTFAPILDSCGRAFRLRLRSPDSSAGNAVTVIGRRSQPEFDPAKFWNAKQPFPPVRDGEGALANEPSRGGDAWGLWRNEERLKGALSMHLACGLDAFEPVSPIGELTLYRYTKACTRYHTVGRSIVAPLREEARSLVLHPGFDPSRSVVLSVGEVAGLVNAEDAFDESSPVSILKEEPTSIRLSAKREHPGWLVIAQPFFPGWRARITGASTPIVRANYAFCAVRLPAGESTIELEYAPASFRWGAWISLASLALLAILVITSRRRGVAPLA